MHEQHHPWWDRTLSPDERARLVVAAMTEDEKLAWLSGPMALPFPGGPALPDGALGSAACYPAVPRLGLPAIQQSDAGLGVVDPGGVRPDGDATALPSSLLLGASFDTATAYETGALVGRQARAQGFAVQLAGGANLVREATGGRSFEYVSEDPLLTGRLVGASVAGLQTQRVVSTVKHFSLNAQETGRVLADARIEEPAHRESDLLAFQIAIEDGRPGAVMAGYNLVNGEHAGESAHLLRDVLKGEWAFDGWVMSDWGATHSTEKAALAGLDVQSGATLDPEPYFGPPLREAVRAGRVPRERVDDMVGRQLRALFGVGVLDDPPVPGGPVDRADDDLVAQRAAERGLVLLKNDGDLLPARRGLARVLVVGSHADVGVLSGGGSSNVTPVDSVVEDPGIAGVWWSKVHHPSSVLQAITAEAAADRVDFVDGADPAVAVAAARDADLVVVVVEEWRAEGLDARGLGLPGGQEELIVEVAAANPRTVVVVQSGGAISLPWAALVPAVIAAFYPGIGGGPAIAGVLFGRVNPSGRLPVTFPASIDQLPRPEQRDPSTTTSNPAMGETGGVFEVSYDVEGSDVGYRWFARERLVPQYPFGWGLSYTTFELDDLDVTAAGADVTVSASLTNTGDRAGAHVTQVYVTRTSGGPEDFVPRLAAFTRTHLEPGETRPVRLRLEPRILARWSEDAGAFRVAGGRYVVGVRSHALDDAGPAVAVQLEPVVLTLARRGVPGPRW